MKFCKKCKMEKDFSEFHKNRNKSDGLNILCKPCNREHVKNWALSNPEKVKETAKRNYNRTREERKVYLKDYLVKNKARLTEINTAYNKSHPEQRKDTQRRYRYNKISDRVLFIRSIVRTARSNAKLKGIEFNINSEIIDSLITIQNNKCVITGKTFTYDTVSDFRARPYAPSLDRKDNSLGYTYSNIQIVTVMVNKAKNEFTQEMFDEMCKDRMKVINNGQT